MMLSKMQINILIPFQKLIYIKLNKMREIPRILEENQLYLMHNSSVRTNLTRDQAKYWWMIQIKVLYLLIWRIQNNHHSYHWINSMWRDCLSLHLKRRNNVKEVISMLMRRYPESHVVIIKKIMWINQILDSVSEVILNDFILK